MTARLFTLDPLEGFRPKTFAGHKSAVIGAYFSVDGETVGCTFLITTLKFIKQVDLYAQQRWSCFHLEAKGNFW